MKRNTCGRKIYTKLVDTYGNSVVVQESGSVLRRCWLFCKTSAGEQVILHLGRHCAISPHLSPANARRVAKALLRFADGK